MKTIVQKLFKRENLIALILVFASLISVLEIPQQFGISETKLILILIGFLAIDALIEKIGYLDELETRIKRIESVSIPLPNSVILRKRETLSSFAERIAGKKDILVFAISANNLLGQQYRTIESALKSGTNFRFLLVAPDSPAILSISLTSPTETNSDTQARWIDDSIGMLKKLAEQKSKGKLELRLCQGVPQSSIISCNNNLEDGWIQVEQHTYRQTPSDRPLFILHYGERNEWYRFYKEMCEDIWARSRTINL